MPGTTTYATSRRTGCLRLAEMLRRSHLYSLSQVKQLYLSLLTEGTMQRADIRATGFWGRQQCSFFDIRVFHPNAQSYRQTSIQNLYRRHEQAKKREYGDRIIEVENGSFTPLVFATTGGMGREATLFYRRVADQISTKRDTPYSRTMAWIRCTLYFALRLCASERVAQPHTESPMPA